jgi:hypothetical protein
MKTTKNVPIDSETVRASYALLRSDAETPEEIRMKKTVAVKCGVRAKLKPRATVESGTIEDNGRKIPFRKHALTGGRTITYYGPTLAEDPGNEAASMLVMRETPGKPIKWSMMIDGERASYGEAARRQLQGKWTVVFDPARFPMVDGARLYRAVEQIILTPDALNGIDGALLRAVNDAGVALGEPRFHAFIQAATQAAHAMRGIFTKREENAQIVLAFARRLRRIPTVQDILRDGSFADEKEARAALREAGFGWLIRPPRGG